MKAWIKQKGWSFSKRIPPEWLPLTWDIYLFLPLDLNWNMGFYWFSSLPASDWNYTIGSPGSQAFGLGLDLHQWVFESPVCQLTHSAYIYPCFCFSRKLWLIWLSSPHFDGRVGVLAYKYSGVSLRFLQTIKISIFLTLGNL